MTPGKTDIENIQGLLKRLGYDPGPIDGQWGPRTATALAALTLNTPPVSGGRGKWPTQADLKKIAPQGRDETLAELASVLRDHGDEYGVNTPLRLCHFLAQAAQESDGFKTLHEYWGPTVAQRGYEGRADLGNTQPGDGKRYMGRGIFMLTGRANYRAIGTLLGYDLEGEPELAAEPTVATLIALSFWRTRHCNDPADRDDIEGVTRKINGGLNGLSDRKAYLKRAKEALL